MPISDIEPIMITLCPPSGQIHLNEEAKRRVFFGIHPVVDFFGDLPCSEFFPEFTSWFI